MNPSRPLPIDRKRDIATHKRYKSIESVPDTEHIKIPEVVVILGSGPKGRPAWPRIPKDAYVITVNEAVNIKVDHPKECCFTPTMWVVNDRNVLDTPYFVKANKNFHGIRCFGDICSQLMRQRFIYTKAQVAAVRENRFFTIPRGAFHKNEQGSWFHDPKVFKPGGTVAAAAIWIAYIKGPPKRIYLCGIDMSRDVHYSNPVEPAHPDHRHGEEWGTSRPALDGRIAHFASLGVKFYTLSETKLQNVEYAESVR